MATKRKMVFTNEDKELTADLQKLLEAKLKESNAEAELFFNSDRTEILRQLRLTEPNVEVILITGRNNRKTTQLFDDNEFVAYAKEAHENVKIITYSFDSKIEGSDGYIDRGFDENAKRANAQQLYNKEPYAGISLSALHDIDLIPKMFDLLTAPASEIDELITSFELVN